MALYVLICRCRKHSCKTIHAFFQNMLVSLIIIIIIASLFIADYILSTNTYLTYGPLKYETFKERAAKIKITLYTLLTSRDNDSVQGTYVYK